MNFQIKLFKILLVLMILLFGLKYIFYLNNLENDTYAPKSGNVEKKIDRDQK